MFQRLGNQRTVIDDGAVGDGVRAVAYGDGGRDKIAVGIFVACTDLRELTRSAADGILMTIRTSSSIEYWAQACAGVVVQLETGLVEGVGIAGRMCNDVADAF